MIELKDENNQKLDPNEEIGLGYLASKTIKIVLSHNKETSLIHFFPIDFKVIESLLSKFIKSLGDKKLGTFYDLDDPSKLITKIQELINESEYKDLITFELINQKEKLEIEDNQTLKVKFKQNNTTYEEVIDFNFNVALSPLSKFIKSLGDKTTWDETFYDRDGLEKVKDKLASLLKKHPNIDYQITSELKWELGKKKIKIEFLDKTNNHKQEKEFDFTITDSPLSKFIKSLGDKTTWDETFYDRDGLEKVKDKLASLLKKHPNIDYQITSELKWELGKKKIKIEFLDKTNNHKQEKEFDFTITDSPLSKFIKSLGDKTTWDETFYDRDGLEKVKDKLASLLKKHPNIDYQITSELKWELGKKKIKIEFLDKTNNHKQEKEFDFTITDSPLSKFIKSLGDKTTWDETFYDRDGLEKVKDKLASLLKKHPNIDYQITSELKWELGKKKIKIEFLDKTNNHKQEKEFDFTITDSPLSKFIKSLGDKTTWDETFYDRDGLEKVKDKLASLLKKHPNIDYQITSELKWELGKKKIKIEFLDKTNNHKQEKEFDFTITDSPLSKFIKSLGGYTNLYNFYDIEGWDKLEANIKALVDSTIFKDLITFDPIDKKGKWEVKANQTLKVKFKQKDTPYEEEVEFKFNVLLSPFTKYLNRISNSTIGEITYNLNYIKNRNKFIEKYKELIKHFFEKNKLDDGQIPDYENLTEDFDFESSTKDINIKITYKGVIRHVTLKLVLKKLNLSEYEVKDLTIDFSINPNNDKIAFEKSSIDKREILKKVIEELKRKVEDFKNIDIDEYMSYFDFKNFDNIYADFDNRTYNLDLISKLNKFVKGEIKVKLNTKKNSVVLNDLVKRFLEQLKKTNPELFKFEINNDYKFYFDLDGLKDFVRLKAKYEELITKKMNEILQDDKYWLGKILKEQKITDKFKFDNFDINDNYEFGNTDFNMTMKYSGKIQANKFTFEDTKIANLLNFEIITNEVEIETAKKFLDDLDKHKQTHELTEGMMKEDKKEIDRNYSVHGLMNDDIDDWINIKKFIDNGFATKQKNLLNDYGLKWSRELSSSKNGYFYYSTNKNIVLNVKVDKYNNKGNYKDEPNALSFSTGKIEVELYTLTNKNKINGSWISTNKKYDLINRVEWEWYAKFRSLLDNGNGYKNSLIFGKGKGWRYIIEKWLVGLMTYWISPEKWVTHKPGVIKPVEISHFEEDYIVIDFAIKGRPLRKNDNHGFTYALKLGGTGHIAKIQGDKMSLYDDKWKLGDTLKEANLEKVDLKFRLYRTDNPYENSEDYLLPIGKDTNYILAEAN